VPTPSSGEEQTKAVSGHTLESAELRVVRGTFRGMSCALGAGTVFIGRSSECDLPLKGAQGVSRRHCKVQYLGNRFVIIDLESRNGTIVNGQSVERKILEKGDRISLGDEVIEFVVESLSDLRADTAVSDATDTALAPRSFAAGAAAATDPAQPIAPRGHDAAFGLEHTERVRRTSPETQQETLPPRAAAPDDVDVAPPVPAGDERPTSSTFMTIPDQPAVRRRAGPLWIAAGLVVVGAVAAIWFIVDGPKDAPQSPQPPTSAVAVTPPAAPASSASSTTTTTTTTTTIAPETGTATGTATATGAPAPPATATATTPATIEPLGATNPPPPEPGPPPTAPHAEPVDSDDVGAAPVFVRAASTGRVQRLEVVIGDVVEAGAVVATLSGDGGALARKLDALRKEEREFAAAAASDSAAKADLAAIRSELQKLESKLKPRPVTAPVGGTVVEIFAEQGSLIRDGMPLVSIRAARPSR
jgi:pSer/pThr/pTyr-binding forkhead associated (FHA) protein